MYITQDTIKVSDLRKHTFEVIEEIEKSEKPVTVFSRSEPKIIIMSCTTYKKLHEPQTLAKEDIDFFINPPEYMMIKKKGVKAAKLIRKERD